MSAIAKNSTSLDNNDTFLPGYIDLEMQKMVESNVVNIKTLPRH